MNSFYGNKESLIKSLKVGDTIEITEEHDEKVVKREYVITEIYPYMVRTKEKKKKGREVYRCFTYGDLIVLGYEMQSLDVESMRKTTGNCDINRTQYHSRKEV